MQFLDVFKPCCGSASEDPVWSADVMKSRSGHDMRHQWQAYRWHRRRPWHGWRGLRKDAGWRLTYPGHQGWLQPEEGGQRSMVLLVIEL